jgi:hypothetical protein
MTFTIQSASVPDVETCNSAKISPASVILSLKFRSHTPIHQDDVPQNAGHQSYFLGVILLINISVKGMAFLGH